MIDKILKAIATLAPFLEPYPPWVKVLFSSWAILSSILLVALVLAKPTKTDTKPINDEAKDDALEGNDLPSVRARHQVRALGDLENQIALSKLPNGVYGYVPPSAIGREKDPAIYQRKSPEAFLEIHKLSSTEILLVGFVSQESALRLETIEGTMPLLLFPDPWEEARTVAAIPMAQIDSSSSRPFKNSHVLDLIVRGRSDSLSIKKAEGGRIGHGRVTIWNNVTPGSILRIRLMESTPVSAVATLTSSSSDPDRRFSHEELVEGVSVELGSNKAYTVEVVTAFLNSGIAKINVGVIKPDGSSFGTPYEFEIKGTAHETQIVSSVIRTAK